MDLPLEPLSELDRAIFGCGSDNPFDGKDAIYLLFEECIDAFDDSKWADRCSVMGLETQIAMLWRLSSYFQNVITRREKAREWQRKALAFFDRETAERGDAADVAEWRIPIIRNFERLQSVLLPADPSDDAAA